ncbi:rab3 GTPase-activating protein catalytic subunit-like [Pollicipes pollicipes]|nr:rab3 GTPase-activating protein catalytic subunit-like [Pollicipes pollicipes]
MRIKDNLWQEAWATCKPVPARRQRRLFDETREAERLLHQLLVEELEPDDLAAVGQQLGEAARRLQSAAKADWEASAYSAVGELLARCEHHVLRRRSLVLKLEGVQDKDKFVQQLIGGAEVAVPGGANGGAARHLEKMLTARQGLPPPVTKEYILRVTCARPGPGSRPLAQRLRCLISDQLFRVTASLSQDTMFS